MAKVAANAVVSSYYTTCLPRFEFEFELAKQAGASHDGTLIYLGNE